MPPAASGELNPLATQRAAAASSGVRKMRLEAGELVVAPEHEGTLADGDNRRGGDRPLGLDPGGARI